MAWPKEKRRGASGRFASTFGAPDHFMLTRSHRGTTFMGVLAPPPYRNGCEDIMLQGHYTRQSHFLTPSLDTPALRSTAGATIGGNVLTPRLPGCKGGFLSFQDAASDIDVVGQDGFHNRFVHCVDIMPRRRPSRNPIRNGSHQHFANWTIEQGERTSRQTSPLPTSETVSQCAGVSKQQEITGSTEPSNDSHIASTEPSKDKPIGNSEAFGDSEPEKSCGFQWGPEMSGTSKVNPSKKSGAGDSAMPVPTIVTDDDPAVSRPEFQPGATKIRPTSRSQAHEGGTQMTASEVSRRVFRIRDQNVQTNELNGLNIDILLTIVPCLVILCALTLGVRSTHNPKV